jgi:hypothetical protein
VPEEPVELPAEIVKLLPLLAIPETLTTTSPVVAPMGTVTVILAPLHVATVAAAPLNVTVLVPYVEPKLPPMILTDVPTDPVDGDKLTIVGVEKSVAGIPMIPNRKTIESTEI